MSEPSEPRETTALTRRQETEAALPAVRVLQEVLLQEQKGGWLRRLWRSVVRRRGMVLGVFLLLTAIAGLEIFTEKPRYRATAKVEVQPPFMSRSEGRAGGGELADSGSRDLVRTSLRKLRRRGLAELLVAKLDEADRETLMATQNGGVLSWALRALSERVALLLPAGALDGEADGPEEDDADDADLVRRAREALQVRRLAGSRLIEVSFASSDAALAPKALDILLQAHWDLEEESRGEARERALAAYEGQLSTSSRELQEAEASLLAYAAEQSIVDTGFSRDLVDQRRMELMDELTRVEASLLSSKASFEAVRSIRAEDLPEPLETGAIRALHGQVVELESRLGGMTERYGPDWPAVKRLRQEIGNLRSELSRAKQGAIDGILHDYRVAERRRQELLRALDAQRGGGDVESLEQAEYNQMKRGVEALRGRYEALLRRMAAATVAAEAEGSVLLIVEKVQLSDISSRERQWRSFVLAALAALALALVAVFVAAAADTTLSSGGEVPIRVRLLPLGEVPLMNCRGRSWKSRARISRAALRSHLPPLAFREGGGEERAQEAYRLIRTSVLVTPSELPPQVLLVASPSGREGSSTTAANLAIALGETGARTVLVDLNLRRPIQAEVFEVDNRKGMSTFLDGGALMSSEIAQTDHANLYVLPAGPVHPSPAALMSSKRMETRLELLREYFDFIVIDSASPLEYSDILPAAPTVDGAVLVAMAEVTRQEELRELRNLFLRLGVPMLGVVLNGVHGRKSDAAAGS